MAVEVRCWPEARSAWLMRVEADNPIEGAAAIAGAQDGRDEYAAQ